MWSPKLEKEVLRCDLIEAIFSEDIAAVEEDANELVSKYGPEALNYEVDISKCMRVESGVWNHKPGFLENIDSVLHPGPQDRSPLGIAVYLNLSEIVDKLEQIAPSWLRRLGESILPKWGNRKIPQDTVDDKSERMCPKNFPVCSESDGYCYKKMGGPLEKNPTKTSISYTQNCKNDYAMTTSEQDADKYDQLTASSDDDDDLEAPLLVPLAATPDSQHASLGDPDSQHASLGAEVASLDAQLASQGMMTNINGELVDLHTGELVDPPTGDIFGGKGGGGGGAYKNKSKKYKSKKYKSTKYRSRKYRSKKYKSKKSKSKKYRSRKYRSRKRKTRMR